MAKTLTLANGNMLICYDRFGQVYELYYPYIGLENHLAGHYVHRIGVFVDGGMHWLDDQSWEISIDYQPETMASSITATNNELRLQLYFNDVVYNEKTIFIRRVKVTSFSDSEREVRVFFNHQFEIYESHRGDTAYYDPSLNAVIHYKGRRAFLANAVAEGKPFDDYSVGLFGIEGKEGTFRDADDGKLSKNPIEHGLADSVISIPLMVAPGAEKTVHYWLCVGKLVDEVKELNKYVISRTPDYLIETTTDYWHAWITMQNFNFFDLTPQMIKLFRSSLLVIRSHVDNRGAIIASGDSDLLKYGRDTYSYMWPRDGALTVTAMQRAGYLTIADNFFDFCNEVISETGYFMHKYRSDRSLGSSWHAWVHEGKSRLPIQEDETASILIALWEYYKHSKDLEFIEEVYNSLIKKAAGFLMGYRYPELNLPQPSFDLWEEKFGISTYTTAAVSAALRAAANFAQLLGKETRYVEYSKAAEDFRTGLMEHLYDPTSGNFHKLIQYDKGQKLPDQTLDISSAFGVFKFGILGIDDPRLEKAFANAEKELLCQSEVGGMPRYQGDYYFRTSSPVAGNPWIICTMWLAQYYIAKAKSVSELNKAKEWLEWAVKHAGSAGILPEQLHPDTGEHLSATPLTWSHAEYIVTVLDYIEKRKNLEENYN